MSKKRVALVTLYNTGAIGPRYVAGSLIDAGHDVKIFHFKEFRVGAFPTTDYEKHEEMKPLRKEFGFISIQHPTEVWYVPYPTPIEDSETALLLSELAAYKPDVIGISLFTVTVQIARRITKIIHERLPGVPVVWGGIHCIVATEDCLAGMDDPALRAQVPDVICSTEGEVPMQELMEKLDDLKSGQVPKIAGLWFVDGQKVHRNEAAMTVENLDELGMPAYAIDEVLIDDGRLDYKMKDPKGFIKNHIVIFTGRGCPYHCAFCVYSYINDKSKMRVRRRSVAHVMAEVEKRFAENGVTHFLFHDEIFAFQKNWVMEFTREWNRMMKPRGLTFGGYVHPLATDLEMVESLYNAGMTQVGLGLQTGSEKVLKEIYDRPFNREKFLAMSKILAKFPFDIVRIDLITDSPFETEDDRRKTLELLLEMTPPFRVETFSLNVYPHSKLASVKPLMEEVPWDERLFWNMLYHITGTKFLRKETILALSHDTYMRQNPLALEQLALDLNGEFYMREQGAIRLNEKKDDKPSGGVNGQGDNGSSSDAGGAVNRSLARRVVGKMKRIINGK